MSWLRPLGDRLLVRMDAPARVSEGGLWLPEALDEDPLTGEILEVGQGPRCPACGDRITLRPTYAPGQRIVLGPRTPVHDVTLDGETLTVVRASDVIAVMDDQEVRVTAPVGE